MAALAAVVLAGIAVVVLLLNRGGDDYRVNMLFQNASQLVKGNLVQVSGTPIGTIEEITLTDDGQARVVTKIHEDARPLRAGTKAVVRQTSLSGIANRYIDVQPAPATAPEIPNGGTITQADTTTAVDLDQLFNTFGPRERRALQGVLKGFAQLYSGRTGQANRGFNYLNPSLAATDRLFKELTFDEPGTRRFINQTARLVTDIDDRSEDLSGLIVNLEQMTEALATRDDELQAAVRQLPAFMRRANTTFVNLRATLDDLDPLVEDSKPVAKKLRPFLAELRPLARDARPTLADLRTLISSPGEDNDLIEATEGNIQVRDIAVGPVHDNGKTRRGAFPEATEALYDATPKLAFARPYAVDLTAWFDGFSHSGYYDALGGVGRIPLNVNAFTILDSIEGTPRLYPLPFLPPALRPLGVFLPFVDRFFPGVQQGVFETTIKRLNNRCPGASERNFDGSNPWAPEHVGPDEPGGCDPSDNQLGR